MPRPRRKQSDLPPRMKRRTVVRADGSVWTGYYYQTPVTRERIFLGTDILIAKAKWLDIEGEPPSTVDLGSVADMRQRHLAGDAKVTAPRTQADRDDYWKHLGPVFGDVQMDRLRPSQMFKYFDARSSKSSAKKELKYLSVLCSWAISRELMTIAHPLLGLFKHMKVASGRTRYVTDAEFSAVRSVAHPILQDYMDLLFLTGQRPGDIRKLRWSDIEDGYLHIRPAKVEHSTGIALRIAVVEDLAAALARIRARGVTGLKAILLDPDGNPLKEFGWARSEFDRARKAAGVSFQLRDLRAKTATDSASMGEARQLLGHSTETMTAHYVRKHAGQKVQPLKPTKPQKTES